MRKILLVLAALLTSVSAHAADNAVILTPGSGVTMRSIDIGGGVQSMGQSLVNSSGTNVIGAGTTVPVSGSLTNISGTISLPTGASTAANQATEISSLATIATNTGAAIPAGSALIGKVGIDQTTPGTTNGTAIVGINAATALAGNGATGTGSLRVTVASDNSAVTGFGVGATGGAVPANAHYVGVNVGGNLVGMAPGTAGSPSTQVTTVQGATSMTPVQVIQVGATTGGLTNYFVQPTASDNHVVIKAGAGQVYAITATNNSATINYLRLYNATTGFNGCNSATNIVGQWAIPASTSGAGVVFNIPQGIAFATGISICVTSGYATTDTTNATASAMSVNVSYN